VSGGHFNDCGYIYYNVYQFADELEQDILNNKVTQEYGWCPDHSDEVIEYLKEQLSKMRKMAEIMRHIDYLYSGNHGDDSFMERIEEVEEKYKDT
jgi:hypothetical protein